MTAKRYFAASAREALSAVRRDLGEDAVVLANRKVPGGVEITAMSGDQVDAVVDLSVNAVPAAAPASSPEAFESFVRRTAKPAVESSTAVFLRERAERSAKAAAAKPAPRPEPVAAAPVRAPVAPVAPVVSLAPVPVIAPEPDRRLMDEIQSMKGLLADQLAAFAWSDGAKKHPLQARLTGEMLGAGFSPALARSLMEKLPASMDEDDARKWLAAAVSRNLLACGDDNPLDRGGVFALVGPTGVGKTTTTAKLAARYAMRYGARNVGLVTTDSYRIGAHDQLKIYGRILGIPVHLARGGSLASLIESMRDKKVVLIDTVGVGQRDPRVPELMAELADARAAKILLLNAASQGETLDEVIRIYRHFGVDGAIVTKIDEAARLGGALDCAVRHQLSLPFITNGQRVPEDLHPAQAGFLVHRAFRAGASPAFELKDEEHGILFSRAAQGLRAAGTVHAA